MSSRGDGAAAVLLGVGVLLVLGWMASALLADRSIAVPGWLFPGLGAAWLATALVAVGWSVQADPSPAERFRPPSPAEVRAAVAAVEAVAGPARWTSPYTLHQRFRRGERDGELGAWIGAPPSGDEPALQVALQAPGGGGRDGPRIVRVARGEPPLVVAPGLRRAVERLLTRCDEVVVAGGRIEARVRRPDDALAALGPTRLEELLARLEAAVEAAVAAAPAVSVRAAAAGQACPYCRDPLDAAGTAACEACGTAHHAECLAEHGRCTVLGCKGGKRPRERGSAAK